MGSWKDDPDLSLTQSTKPRLSEQIQHFAQTCSLSFFYFSLGVRPSVRPCMAGNNLCKMTARDSSQKDSFNWICRAEHLITTQYTFDCLGYSWQILGHMFWAVTVSCLRSFCVSLRFLHGLLWCRWRRRSDQQLLSVWWTDPPPPPPPHSVYWYNG